VAEVFIYEVSERAAERIRAFRKTRRITGDQLALGLTRNGYPITRSVLANYENGRFKTVPLDMVVAAMRYFHVSFSDFMTGPLCGSCNDKPPAQYICKTCNRTTNQLGELVSC
jgi:transcriptional regulator with XRE-family HTH domain